MANEPVNHIGSMLFQGETIVDWFAGGLNREKTLGIPGRETLAVHGAKGQAESIDFRLREVQLRNVISWGTCFVRSNHFKNFAYVVAKTPKVGNHHSALECPLDEK